MYIILFLVCFAQREAQSKYKVLDKKCQKRLAVSVDSPSSSVVRALVL